MLTIKKVTVNKDWGIRTVEFLKFENPQKMEEIFHISYVEQLLTEGNLKFTYSKIGHPLERDEWNGYIEYSKVS